MTEVAKLLREEQSCNPMQMVETDKRAESWRVPSKQSLLRLLILFNELKPFLVQFFFLFQPLLTYSTLILSKIDI